MVNLPVLGVLLFISGTFAQAQEFEVASVRPSPAGGVITNYTPTLEVAPGATLRFSNLRLRDLVVLAYGIGVRQFTGPVFLVSQAQDSPRFDVVAKVPDNAKREQIPLMLQKLLEERFKMKAHREPRSIQAYALIVAKGGAKLQESKIEAGQESGCTRSMAVTEGATLAAECRGLTMVNLAQQLQSLAPGYFREGPIVDRTGLMGAYDLKLEWITQGEANEGASGPTLFAAVQKFGLVLEKRKEDVEFLVVDEAQPMPTEN